VPAEAWLASTLTTIAHDAPGARLTPDVVTVWPDTDSVAPAAVASRQVVEVADVASGTSPAGSTVSMLAFTFVTASGTAVNVSVRVTGVAQPTSIGVVGANSALTVRGPVPNTTEARTTSLTLQVGWSPPKRPGGVLVVDGFSLGDVTGVMIDGVVVGSSLTVQVVVGCSLGEVTGVRIDGVVVGVSDVPG